MTGFPLLLQYLLGLLVTGLFSYLRYCLLVQRPWKFDLQEELCSNCERRQNKLCLSVRVSQSKAQEEKRRRLGVGEGAAPRTVTE